jgi:hypothetical protein
MGVASSMTPLTSAPITTEQQETAVLFLQEFATLTKHLSTQLRTEAFRCFLATERRACVALLPH